MHYSRELSEGIWEMAAGNVSALAAMLHFRRTGIRFKPRLIVSNGAVAHSLRPRPILRIVNQASSAAAG